MLGTIRHILADARKFEIVAVSPNALPDLEHIQPTANVARSVASYTYCAIANIHKRLNDADLAQKFEALKATLLPPPPAAHAIVRQRLSAAAD